MFTNWLPKGIKLGVVRRAWNEILALLNLYRWTLSFLWKSKPLATISLIVIVILQSIVPAVQIWITKVLIDEIIRYLTETSGSYHIFDLLILEAVIAYSSTLLGALNGYINNVIAEDLGFNIHLAINEHSALLDMSYFESPEYYDYLQRAQELAQDSPTVLLNRLTSLASTTLSLASISVFVWIYNIYIFFGLLITVIPSVMITLHYERKRFDLINDRVPDERLASYYTDLVSSVEYAKEVKLWKTGDYFIDKWSQLKKRFIHENLTLVKNQAIAMSLGDFVTVVGYYLAYALVITSVLNAQLTIGDLTLYIAAFLRIQSSFERILSLLAKIYIIHFFIANLQHFFSFDSRLINVESEEISAPATSEHGLIVKDLSFTYPYTDRCIIKNVGFKIKPGECIALVGKNGSGKSTLVKLLLRLYDPDSGQISLNGVEIHHIPPKQLYQNVSAVFQDYSRYYLSLHENIAIGNIRNVGDTKMIKEVIRETGIDQILEKLPNAEQTILGRYFENGYELSLGQWQKVALARAIASDSKLIVLDEPTAALDPESEAEFYSFVSSIIKSKQKMILLVSHRYSTVRMADRILVMNDGKIVEEGTHEQLVTTDTMYSKLYNIQAKNYQD